MKISLLESILKESPEQAWKIIFDNVWEVFSREIQETKPVSEIMHREKKIENLEFLLSSTAWELWFDYQNAVEKASGLIIDFWKKSFSGKAILILDGLSLREVPFIVKEAKKRQYSVKRSFPCGIQLPPDTTHFAQSLGFSQRSILENNRGKSSYLKGAYTESSYLPWKDCIDLLKSTPNILFWHHWPDFHIHNYASPGQGLSAFMEEAVGILYSDDFWQFIEVLSTGRRLVITSDHGYASSGFFPDISEKQQAEYVKKMLKSGRMIKSDENIGPWVPPITLPITTAFGKYHFALGRKKWKSAGGYPTLSHGGLSLLETIVPFIEIEKNR